MSRRPIRGGAVLILTALICLCPLVVDAAEEHGPSAPQSPPSPPSAAAIPLPEIATRAAEVTDTLQAIRAHLASGQAIQAIAARLPELSRDIDGDLARTTAMLRGEPTLAGLQARQKLWHERKLLTAGWLKTLTARAVQLKDFLRRLDGMHNTWMATREAAHASKAPAMTLQQVDATLESLDAIRSPVEAEHKKVLDLQAAVAKEVARCESMFAEVARALDEAVGSLLRRDGPPIWSPDLWIEAQKSLRGDLQRVLSASWEEITRYAGEPSRALALHTALFVLTVLCFGAGRRQIRRWAVGEADVSSSMAVFDRPWSAAYILSLLYTTGPHSPTPDSLQSLFALAAFPPIIRLVAPSGPGVLRSSYLAALLLGLDVVRQFVAGPPLLEQSLLILETITGIAALAWARKNLWPALVHSERPVLQRILPLANGLLVLSLALGLCAAALGYMRLARLIASTVFGLGFLVLVLYCFLSVLNALVAFSLRAWPLRRLLMVQHHHDLLVRRIHRMLVVVAVATGVIRSLDHLGLFQPALTFATAILTTKLERGSISITPADVLAFFITVWVAYLLSAFIRFALQEDVYSRLQVPVGLSYAASSLLNYVILALGVIVGLGVLGVDLTRLTVLAGALGVGIGFGLQSVVNNFVSGLILLFERPIHVGDSIEVGSLTGEVRRIGIRASTIRTRQGAEIIIPNAQLVTDKVTNWTLSDQLRRIDIPVGVNYGAVPKEVIEALERTALAHPRVLKHPPPHGLIMGFGESAINFELRAWTDEFADWIRVRSDLTSAIHDAVVAAGWSFPFPQREVRIIDKPTA